MYIPKGMAGGMEFDLFAMITDFEKDKVQDTPEQERIKEPCNMPYLYCGIPFRKYPDARPLGYPFDRKPYSAGNPGTTVNTLEEYVSHVPNTKATVVRKNKINF